MHDTVAEVGSALNGTRLAPRRVLSDADVMLIVVECCDRLSRFGVEHIEITLAAHGRRLLVLHGEDMSMAWCER